MSVLDLKGYKTSKLQELDRELMHLSSTYAFYQGKEQYLVGRCVKEIEAAIRRLKG